ncbi:hypothetical protein OG555_26255 [Kribbella sp. NBC_01484]|nr:hypothetical protein [Kribbella sp. NBC_01484]
MRDGYGVFSLYVDGDNVAALRLYLGSGFVDHHQTAGGIVVVKQLDG